MDKTVRELAEERGLKSFDTALPMRWYEDVHDKTGFWPQEYGFVWSYDKATVWGEPVPLTDASEVLLAFYKKMSESSNTPPYRDLDMWREGQS